MPVMKKYLWLLCGTLLLAASSAYAHQQKAAISTVLFNPRTENIEVMHRFDLHDAEHAVKEIFGKGADILDPNKPTQAQFSEYVSQRFYLFNASKKPLPLKVIGFETDGKFFWVYQETEQPAKLENMIVRNDSLRDIWPLQVNTINVEGKGDIKTLIFSDNIELLTVEFGNSAAH